MEQADLSYANLANLPLIESLYENYLVDPQSVDDSWRHFFEGMEFAKISLGRGAVGKGASDDLRIYYLIQAYRSYGHLFSSFNPVATQAPVLPEELNLQKLGFAKEEMERPFPTCGFLDKSKASLKEIIDALQKTYCGLIGVEYMGMGAPEVEAWLQNRIEPYFPLQLEASEKLEILKDLNKAELFESFIHTKYVGQKRFSLEGGETLIPMLAMVLESGGEEHVSEVILGMAHRGRLNVLANILNKSYSAIFREFEDHYTPDLIEGTGDVKYHKGFGGGIKTKQGKSISVSLSANPSHLEAVDPVVEGEARAKQERKRDKSKREEVVPILIHGDAAIAGQGVVYETLQLGNLNGYGTGGTLHIVINNNIGFTTLPKDTRSTRYCTDIARAFGAPVFHVNAEDPEGCVAVAKIAIQIRQKFKCDVFIDLNCYRKYGHNEGDEPTFTQPLEYKLIKEKKSIREIYRNKLIQEGVLEQSRADAMEAEFKASLHQALESIQSAPAAPPQKIQKENSTISTAVPQEKLLSLSEKICTVPAGFHIHPKIQKLLQERLKMVRESTAAIDWGMGEALALSTIVDQGIDLRLSGQDSRRGTFSHRHSVWVDQENQQKYFPLSHISEKQGLCDIFNSPLSEYAVLGFEFGYSLFHPECLVIWEAQFGDFNNGAQIIIDQFISASEQKWGQSTNLTLLLPHGYEGMGPEHSSGRMERFLQLCGDDNMQVANCTTPAQYFHLLRRQALRSVQKPLIVFTPKALLRHPVCVSSLNDFAKGTFQEVIDDPQPPAKTKRLIFCCGKVYYELAAEREKRKNSDTAIIRIEQLYPFPKEKIKELLKKYAGFQECVWVQEEHRNMGAWDFIRPLLEDAVAIKVNYAGRVQSASPAAGSFALHKKQLAQLLDEAFTQRISS